MAELDLGKVVGEKGDTGATPNVSASASVDANIGTPSVEVTKTGTTENPNFNFSFHNLKGEAANINSLCMFATIPASGWSSTTDSDGYYTNMVQLSAEINAAYKPLIGQIGSAVDVQPTSAEKAAFNLVDVFHFANGSSVSQITAKAKTKPTTTFYIVVYAGSESIIVIQPLIRAIDVGTVTVSNGIGEKTVDGVLTTSRLIVGRSYNSANSLILTATCTTNGKVRFGAYDTSGSGGNYTGDISHVVLLIDNT